MKQKSNSGFTLVEVVVVVAVICVLIAIILPVCISARRRGQDVACLSNLQQINLAFSLYISDYDSHYPTAISAVFEKGHAQSKQTWREMLVPYLKSPVFPQCPNAAPSADMVANARLIDLCGYAFNNRLSQHTVNGTSTEYFGRDESHIGYPSVTVSLCDARPGFLTLNVPDTVRTKEHMPGIWLTDLTQDILSLSPGALRHHGGANYMMADGHVKWLRPEQISTKRRSDGVQVGFGL